jgi:hypothetical protein
VDAEAKARASLGVCLRELDALGDRGTATLDSNLVACNVVLSTTSRASGVESDGLGAEKVVTRGETGGDLEVELSAVVVQVLGAPEVVVTLGGSGVLLPGVLVDLEEVAGAVGSSGILNLAHVGQDGAPVGTTNTLLSAGTAVALLVHLDRHCVACLEATLASGGSRLDVA